MVEDAEKEALPELELEAPAEAVGDCVLVDDAEPVCVPLRLVLAVGVAVALGEAEALPAAELLSVSEAVGEVENVVEALPVREPEAVVESVALEVPQ